MESSSSQPIISPEDVLESLMNDGTIDAIRLKIITQLKANVSSPRRFVPFDFCLLRFLFSLNCHKFHTTFTSRLAVIFIYIFIIN